MAPSQHDIEVATGALRTEADTWSEQGGRLIGVANKVGQLRFTGLEAGIFQVMLGAYTDVVNLVHDRCTEGANEMGQIGTTLRNVADVYDDEERRHVHTLSNLY